MRFFGFMFVNEYNIIYNLYGEWRMGTGRFNDTPEILTFGKYKGQPVDVLQSDPDYCEWLINQKWLPERFPHICTLIINNFAKAEDTPVHNSLQARFVEPEFPKSFCDALFKDIREKRLNTATFYEREGSKPGDYEILCQNFEVRGWDVAVCGKLVTEEINRINHGRFCAFVEIKPEISDDYPSVLRQMKTNRMNCSWADVTDKVDKEDIGKNTEYRYVLVYDRFTATGVTVNQMNKIFAASGFYVLSFNEIDGIFLDQLDFK